MYSILLVITFVFLMMYIKRMIMTCFLVIISPLAALSYSIDKMGNGKSEILNQWMKEFCYNVLIQPFHCIVYIVFVGTAMNLVYGSDLSNRLGTSIGDLIFAVICICCIFVGDKIIRTIFGFNKSKSNIVTKMFAGSMVMNAVKDIGKIRQAKAAGAPEQNESAPALMPNGESSEGASGAKALQHMKNEPGNTGNNSGGTAADGSAGEEMQESPEHNSEPGNSRQNGENTDNGSTTQRSKRGKRIAKAFSDHTPTPLRNFGRGYVNSVKNATLINPIQGRVRKHREKKKPSLEEQFLLASKIYASQHGLNKKELDLKIQALRKASIGDLSGSTSDIIYKSWIDAMDRDLAKKGAKRPSIALREIIDQKYKT